ncbi:MAG: hypothetical protein H6751_15020 [Candidatus Omnitrophica bacterium]|nr:hypothetical protein [Candidatus Omnitrophota bacterium]
MKKILTISFLILVGLPTTASAGDPAYRDIYPDTWVATDALGRTMPDLSEAGPVKEGQDRVVGIFYITWHRDSLANMKSPYNADVTKVLAEDPEARLDGTNPLWTEGSYHWGEPELGYFLSKDEYVIRKDMSMLTDAGVDVLLMDVTNAVRYWDEWDVVFPVMEKMMAEGNRVPKFAFWSFNGPSITVVQDLYDKIYKENKFKDLWFYWEGKPLLLYNGTPTVDANRGGITHPNPHYDPAAKTDPNHPHYGDPDYTEEFYQDYTKEVKEFFTLRTMWWGYYKWAGERFVGTEDNWSFGYDMGNERVRDMEPKDLASTHKGAKEEMAVTPAQHPVSLTGKSWTREHGEPELNEYDLPKPTHVPWLGKTVDRPEGYGIYFQERWDEALEVDPSFIYINDWNEWTAGKYNAPEGETYDFMRRKSNFRFIDQYNSEFNRSIQPMKGGYTDNYYMQMAQNIRRYKGVRPIPKSSGENHIEINGKFDDWKSVEVEYRDTIGDTAHRDYPGYGGLHYAEDSGRNDIVASKVAIDGDKLCFYAETKEPLTPHTDPNWMLLLIDADQNHNTGWCGYDYLINKNVTDEKHTTISRYNPDSPDGPWVEAGQAAYRYTDKSLEISLPRDLLGLDGNELSFDFHWSDNPTDLKDAISLCTNGDSAPNRRFNYRFIWKR